MLILAPAGDEIVDPDQLHQFVDRHHQGLFYCTICEKTAATRRDVRNHVESIHYPNAFVYDCQFCGKTLKTKVGQKINKAVYTSVVLTQNI